MASGNIARPQHLEHWIGEGPRGLELSAQEVALRDVLDGLCLVVDALSSELMASVLLADRDGTHWRVIVGPSLPEAWRHALATVQFGPATGAPGAAFFRRQPVVVTNVATDPLYVALRTAGLPAELRACWSIPFQTRHARVAGTVTVYCRVPRGPDARELRVIERVAHLASLATEHSLTEEAGRTLVADITDRRQADSELCRSEAYLAQAQSISNTGSWVLNPVTGALSWSLEMYRICGFDARDGPPSYQAVVARIHPEDAPRVEKSVQRAIRERRDFAGDYRFVLPNGTTKTISYLGRPVAHDGEDLVEYVGAIMDVTEQRRIEHANREREDRFTQLATNMKEVFFVVDAQVQETFYVSPGYETTWGRSCQSLYEHPRSFLEAVHPDDQARLLASTAQVQRGETPGALEYRIIRPDGQVRWLLTDAVPIRDERGVVYRICGVASDITERHRAQEELRESQEQFRLLLDSTAEGIYGLDVEGRCTFVNLAGLRLLGFQEREGLLGQVTHTFWHHSHPDGSRYPSEECPVFRAFSRGQGAHVDDEVFWRPDGTSFPVEYWSHPIFKHGAVVGAVVTFLDITGRRHAQDALENSEARFRKLTEASFDGIAIVVDGVLREANRGFAEMFGYTPDEVLGLPATAFAAEQSRAVVRRQIDERLEGTYEFVGQRKDGRTILVEATAKAHSVDGHPGRLTALRDVTEQRRLESQSRQVQKMEAVGRLAGGVAHDFNNLLTVITTSAAFVLEDLPAGDSSREDVELIRKAATDATALTQQLLAFSRQQVVAVSPVAIGSLVANAERMLRRLIGEDIVLSTVLDTPPATVMIDPGQLEQVIVNLAVNARDAMPTGGKLTIETTTVDLDEASAQRYWPATPGRYAVLAVSDTGIGMDAQTQARIFEPFFTTKAFGAGTGLGLATVYGIVKQSGGFIWVYSEPGHGATFRIYLPLADGPPVAIATKQVAPDVPPGTETVLLAEDAPAVRTAARQILERYGYTVLEAPSGKAALGISAKRREPIHLLLTDIVMPGMSGRELAEALTALRPEVKVLYMSGYTDDAVVRHGVLMHDVAYLQKPFSPETLARKVRDVLDSSSAS